MSALTEMYTPFAAALDLQGVECSFGWRELSKRIDSETMTYRVVVSPGPKHGKIGSPHYAGENPRVVGAFQEAFVIQCWALDSTKPNDEMAQYTALMSLVNVVLVQCRLHSVVSTAMTIVQKERQLGLEARIDATIDCDVVDVTLDETEDPTALALGIWIRKSNGTWEKVHDEEIPT